MTKRADAESYGTDMINKVIEEISGTMTIRTIISNDRPRLTNLRAASKCLLKVQAEKE